MALSQEEFDPRCIGHGGFDVCKGVRDLAIPIANPKAQIAALGDEITAAVREVIESCQFVGGPYVAALEEEVAAACDAKYGIAVNSGTDAITIALAACGVGPGDEVITTPFTFVATTESIVLLGAKPVYVDIEPDTFNLDPSLVASKITSKTKAILPVHLYGQCCNISKIQEIADQHGLKLVADGAQAIGSRHLGRGIGAYGDAATLSFYVTKNLGGCGDGGMILTNNEELATVAKQLRSHGQDSTYSYIRVGFCSRLDGIQAAILRVKLRRLQAWNEARRANAEYYIRSFEGLPIGIPVARPENYHIYHQFTIRHPRRDELKAKLAERGVGSAVYYPSPLHLERAYAYLGHKQGDFPEAEKAAAEVLSLPVLPELTTTEREEVAGGVRAAVEELIN
jgi:dTDP-4-amino-4,6-dideoxygalactose transaminase